MKRKQKHHLFSGVFLSAILFVGALCASVPVAYAIRISNWPSADSIAAQLERRYHLNLESMRDQGENFNVASQKGRAPEVTLYFSPSDPTPGKEVEAKAFPRFFSNQTDSLYYTWYLKRKDCDLKGSGLSDFEKKSCDFNGDDKITVEDWKILAMQKIAADNFDATCSLDDSLSDEDRAECAENMYNKNAPSRINPSGNKGTDRDRDGYVASFGGDGRSEYSTDCSSSGSSSSASTPEDDGFTPSSDPDGYNLFVSTNGTDRTSTLTISPSQTLYVTTELFAEASEYCVAESGTNDCSGDENWTDAEEYVSSGDSLAWDGSWTRTVTPVSTVFDSGTIYHLYWRDNSVPAIASAKLIVSSSGSSGVGSCSGRGSVCYIHDFKDGYNYELPSCKHLFPDNWYIDFDDASRTPRRYSSDDRRRQIGGRDGEFRIEEEHFWRTDPEDPSTARNGVKDEANLAGLGQDTFKWVYAPEDEVGVAVEGASMYNTKYDNSTMMVMWALPKNVCDVDGKSSRTESIKGYGVPIKTATTNIDACLEDNLVDPAEGNQAENIDLSLSYTPEDPAAKLIPWEEWQDASEEERKRMGADMAQTADMVTVNVSSSNATKGAESTAYSWRVFASRDGSYDTRFDSENEWVNITDELRDSRNISRTNGNGVTSLLLNLNLNETDFEDYFDEETDTAYFRVTVNATENFRGQVTESGSAQTVIKISINKKIDIYDVETVTDANTGTMSVRLNSDSPLCTGETYPEQLTICPVLKNQIVGVKFDAEGEFRDFLWTLNGKQLACSRAVSNEDCEDTKQGDTNFFPISGETGELYTLSVTANRAGGNDFDEAGKSHTVSRRFQIVDPDFELVSDEPSIAWSKYLGKYTNLDGTESEDYSKTSFEGIPGGIAKLSAVFRPEALGTFVLDGIKVGDDQNEMVWSINGKPFKWNDTSLSLALDGNVGDIYTVTLAGAYNQPRELRKALYDIWRISPFTSETVRFSKEIQIRLVLPEGSPYAKGKSNTFFASLISAVPPTVLFSVRLILSMGLILLIVGVVFSVMPEGRQGRG